MINYPSLGNEKETGKFKCYISASNGLDNRKKDLQNKRNITTLKRMWF